MRLVTDVIDAIADPEITEIVITKGGFTPEVTQKSGVTSWIEVYTYDSQGVLQSEWHHLFNTIE